jgi:hypothetical protein
MSLSFNIFNVGARIFVLSCVGVMMVGYIFILLVKLGDKTPKPMMAERSRTAFWLSALGVPVFILGMALGFLSSDHENLGLALAVGGLLTMCASVSLNAVLAKSKRAAWPKVPARCTERQLQKRKYATEGGSTDGWVWRVVCEIDYGGKTQVVSPKVHWSDGGQADTPFWSEKKAQQFIAQRISPQGGCKLRVNPQNPVEAELL